MQRVLSGRTSPSAVLQHAPDRASAPPFPPALAPALGASAGVLLALGGIGTWVRVTTATGGGADPATVEAVVGRADGGGWALLVVGILAAAASVAGASARKELRRAGAWAAVLVAATATWAVVAIDRRAAGLAAAAADDPTFDAYHAGFGWGAWLLLLAAIAAALALLVGWLRSIDAGRNP